MDEVDLVSGFALLRAHLDPAAQAVLVADVLALAERAPFFAPMTPWGRPMRVQMTSAGRYGWYSDRRGYRYESRHPSGVEWPPIPEPVLAIWRELVPGRRDPDCCLINRYGINARMGLHRDADEADFSWPVLSISLGDPATFRLGGLRRSDPTRSFPLQSGDVMLLGGAARLAYHGIDRIRFGGSPLIPGGGRINLTLRVVD
jgi:alkylated DNA repair protein (DNA oxidative demethylase)